MRYLRVENHYGSLLRILCKPRTDVNKPTNHHAGPPANADLEHHLLKPDSSYFFHWRDIFLTLLSSQPHQH
ncbi:hypothetical protein NPIL_108531, partial [Nephila pilipes]